MGVLLISHVKYRMLGVVVGPHQGALRVCVQRADWNECVHALVPGAVVRRFSRSTLCPHLLSQRCVAAARGCPMRTAVCLLLSLQARRQVGPLLLFFPPSRGRVHRPHPEGMHGGGSLGQKNAVIIAF